MSTQIISRQQVIELATTMPLDKLASWYEYGLFIIKNPIHVAIPETVNDEGELAEEISAWEAASDEDWLNFESLLAETS